jgi:hypothetical protein
MFNSPFIIPVAFAFAFAWFGVTWIRAHYGIPGPMDRMHRWDHNPKNMAVPPMFQKLMEKAMAERDEEIQALKERVAVLEKIVTDTHKSHSLAEEIDKLRDSK